ncbi:MAG: hypothetical protein AAGJ40_24180 [Planctomycetota bacterium]
MTDAERTFLIHVHSDRLLLLEEHDIINVGNRIEHAWPDNCSVTTGEDDGRYIDILIKSDSPSETWARITDLFLGTDFLSTEIRISSIVTATGDAGWDNYLLLHHFDPDEQLDQYV